MSKFLKIFGVVIIVGLAIGMLIAACLPTLKNDSTTDDENAEKPNIEYSAVEYYDKDTLPCSGGIKLLP